MDTHIYEHVVGVRPRSQRMVPTWIQTSGVFQKNTHRKTRTSSTSSTGLSGREGGGGAADEAARAITRK